MTLGPLTAAELDKLRTLPATTLTLVGTMLTGVAIAAALAASADHDTATSAIDVTLQTVPFGQTGLVLLGILPAAHEHAGRQLHTTLIAVPQRGLLVTAKGTAALLAIALTAVATVAASLAAATTTQQLIGTARLPGDADPWYLVGAATYLTLIGLLAYAVATLVRHLVPALVGLLSLLLIVSPLLEGLGEQGSWLPDRAAQRLYDPTAATSGPGVLVTLAWIALIGAAATRRFLRRDP